MDANAFLQMSIDARMRIIALEIYAETLQEEIAHMKAFAGNLPKYSIKDRPIYEAIRKAHEVQTEVDADIKGYQEQIADVTEAIQAIDDPRCSEVLTRRYIQGENWPQIADKMYYSVRGIFRVADRAMQLIEVPEKYREGEAS